MVVSGPTISYCFVGRRVGLCLISGKIAAWWIVSCDVLSGGLIGAKWVRLKQD